MQTYHPLKLNNPQSYVIDILIKRFQNRQLGRYVITKTFGRCGLTTCIQAYITWLQTFQRPIHSYICTSSEININPLKTNLCRWLHRDIVPSDKYIFLPKSDRRAFFNSYRNPDFIRGIDIGYVHFADMSKWNCPDGKLSSRACTAAMGGVLLDYFILIVHEGNIPKKNHYSFDTHPSFHIQQDIRLMQLEHLTRNPHFLDYAAGTHALSRFPDPSPFYIDLDLFVSKSRRIQIIPL